MVFSSPIFGKQWKKYRNRVLTIFCFSRECTKTKDIFYENLGSTSFIELKEEFVSDERAECFLKMLAKEQHIRTDKSLFCDLKAEKGYLAQSFVIYLTVGTTASWKPAYIHNTKKL